MSQRGGKTKGERRAKLRKNWLLAGREPAARGGDISLGSVKGGKIY